MYYIIATDDYDNIINRQALVAELKDDDIVKVWVVRIKDDEVVKFVEIPLRKIDSYYAHSVGCISCKLPCPEYIKKEIENENV